MQSEKDVTERLTAFRNRDKFSYEAWQDRGLNPSNAELCSKLTTLFNQCTDALKDAVDQKVSDSQLKRIIKIHLSNFKKWDYDTEEREFICDLFLELASILKIDFSDEIDRWVYGWLLNSLMKIRAIFYPEQIVEIIGQNCQSCGRAIDTFIMEKEEDIPDAMWNIVQCGNCKDYSLVSYGPNVKAVKFGNYRPIEELSKEQYTKEQAEIRVEQLRYFRK